MLKIILILALGAFLGALLGHFGKCNSGTCPLTANPWRGAVWGFFLASVAIYPMILEVFRTPIAESNKIMHIESDGELMQLSREKPVIVDFYADWCGACRGIAPIINRLAEENSEKIVVVKVNVDKHKEIAMKYHVQILPTVILLHNGKEVKRFLNPSVYEEYLESIKSY